MSQANPQVQDPVAAAYNHAANLLANGAAPAVVEQDLLSKGLPMESARTIVGELVQLKSQTMRSAGFKNMLWGAVWCIGGLVVTVVSFGMANGNGGGRYVVAWGAVIFGGIQFVRGVYQVATA